VAALGNAVLDFSKMQVGRKGGGKHWTKEEVEARQRAAEKLQRKNKKKLKMPSWLGEEAQKVWKKTVRDMKDFDVLDKVDEDVLAAYCDAVARHKELSGIIRENGYTTINATGTETVAPWVRAQQSYARLIIMYSDKLGLNANARARLAKKIADEEIDENADLFD